MIETTVRNYKAPDGGNSKKALFISFKRGADKQDVEEFTPKIIDLLKQEYDSFVFVIKNPKILSAYLIEMLLLCYNASLKQIGLLAQKKSKELIISSKLDDIFIIGEDEITILKKLEKINNKLS